MTSIQGVPSFIKCPIDVGYLNVKKSMWGYDSHVYTREYGFGR